MRNLYTAQFEVLPLTKPARDVCENIFKAVSNWISGWYDSRLGIKLMIDDNGGHEPQPGHTLVSETVNTELASTHKIIWSYPHKDNLHWSMFIQISRFESSIDFSLRLSLESTQFYIAPLVFDFGRPRIVPLIIREFDCYYGGTKLSSEAAMTVAADVSLLVSDRLLNNERRLPIVIVSPESIGGLPLIDANELASAVAGVAEVYVLTDRWASYAFTDCVGKQLSCYNGALRIYWPLGRRTLEAFCPVYMPHVVREKGSKVISKEMLKEFSGISSFRYIAGPIAEDAEAVLRGVRDAETLMLRKDAQDRGDYEALADSYKTEADGLRSELDRLRVREKVLGDEVGRLHSQAETDQANLKAIYSITPNSLAVEAPPDSHAEVKDLPTIVSEAEGKYRGRLFFTKNAFKSAADTPYKQAERAAEGLEAMDTVCEAWLDSKEKHYSIGSFEEAFHGLGFVYKSRCSQTSVGKWPEEYEMLYKGEKVSIQPHLAIGKGGPETCLRIYFNVDEEENCFVIDHIGRHKTNLST